MQITYVHHSSVQHAKFKMPNINIITHQHEHLVCEMYFWWQLSARHEKLLQQARELKQTIQDFKVTTYKLYTV